METDEATERNSAPITPNWKLDISPIFAANIFSRVLLNAGVKVYIVNLILCKEYIREPFAALYSSLMCLMKHTFYLLKYIFCSVET